MTRMTKSDFIILIKEKYFEMLSGLVMHEPFPHGIFL